MIVRFGAAAHRAWRPWRAAALALWCVLTGPAAASSWLLASPDPRVVPGESFEVVVVASTPPQHWPDSLPAQVEARGGARIAIELAAAEGGSDAPQTATQRRYLGRWPAELLGVATLALRDMPAARLLVEATGERPAGVAALEPASAEARPAALSSSLDGEALRTDETVAPAALGFHEPIYFLVGGHDKRAARFQFSFRYRLFDDHGLVGEAFPVVRGLYFGFTQTSLWDLSSDSKPFRDSSFRPSLFYQWRASDPESGGSLAFAGGYEHESNGRDGEDSRSIDTLFLRADARYYLADGRTYLGAAPKFWFYLDKEDNPDIARYRGYAELGLRAGRDDGLMLTGLLRRGTAGKESVQLDLSYPVRRSIFSGVGAFLHLQYFKGYGETLLDYDERRGSRFRIGLSIVR